MNQCNPEWLVLISSERQYSHLKSVNSIPLKFCSQVLTCFCSHLCFCPFVVYQSHADRNLLHVWPSHVGVPVPLTQLAVSPGDSSEVGLHKKHTSQSLYLVGFFFRYWRLTAIATNVFTSVCPPTVSVLLTGNRSFKKSCTLDTLRPNCNEVLRLY